MSECRWVGAAHGGGRRVVRRYPAVVDGDTLVAIIAALAAVGAVYYARGEVREAKRAAHAAEEQTKIARQLARPAERAAAS